MRTVLPAWALAIGAAALSLPAAAADEPGKGRVVAAKVTGDRAATDKSSAADDVDQDLLEFLGSVDTQTDDSSWFDFLRSTDIGKLAKEKSPPAAPQEKKR